MSPPVRQWCLRPSDCDVAARPITMNKHASADEPPATCGHCGQPFPDERSLAIHE